MVLKDTRTREILQVFLKLNEFQIHFTCCYVVMRITQVRGWNALYKIPPVGLGQAARFPLGPLVIWC